MSVGVEREIRMRERVYQRWVQDGRMKQEKADEELAAMKAVSETLGRYQKMIETLDGGGDELDVLGVVIDMAAAVRDPEPEQSKLI